MADQVRDRRSHERDIRKQHEPLVDVWPATIAKMAYANSSSSGRGSDDPMRSDHANLPMTPKISCRSPQLVFKKPRLEFRVPQATNFVSVCQKNSSSSVENFGARQAKKIIGLVATYVKAPISGHNN